MARQFLLAVICMSTLMLLPCECGARGWSSLRRAAYSAYRRQNAAAARRYRAQYNAVIKMRRAYMTAYYNRMRALQKQAAAKRQAAANSNAGKNGTGKKQPAGVNKSVFTDVAPNRIKHLHHHALPSDGGLHGLSSSKARHVGSGTGSVINGRGLNRVPASTRYTTATAVRSNYHASDVYSPGWYSKHPNAWSAKKLAAGNVWDICTWDAASRYLGYGGAAPRYYDYGNNVTYHEGSVYLNDENLGTPEQFYKQAANLAASGATSSPGDGDWLPLGVFAFTRPNERRSHATMQLAVNKQGLIRGNYTDDATGVTQVVEGSLDRKTQRVAFSDGDKAGHIIETGLYNLTRDESPALLHSNKDEAEQWLLVRLKKPTSTGGN